MGNNEGKLKRNFNSLPAEVSMLAVEYKTCYSDWLSPVITMYRCCCFWSA